MTKKSSLEIQLVAATEFHPPADIDWSPDETATSGEALVEFAGRACYESFDKPNPRTAGNEAYLHHIIEVGHLALLEHATATLYIRGISRSATHELVRHRHFSFSQLSQRFVHPEEPEVVVPALIAKDEDLSRTFIRAVEDARFMYEELLSGLEENLANEPNALLRLKQARQAARSVLPNATESRIVVTGNYRAWREMIAAHATEHADEEMRTVAVAALKILMEQSPVIFSDFTITKLADGTEMASSPYA
ncbi:thymidylate synthase ThyX [Corynebacterium phocae]|uniref:Flavin-dependent thymidylate synthase n=1 Tax=Corynebacterium phocae TaxID=161895 RepID=A0A1L7D2Y2_9CORY|nr:FAD-dependent thymidylate synthase [Corynebacterium phocae]APT92351.1 thymidylate synthase ThyX [Corynebacterium phocae]KAA8724943.1 FAD-dependent thymidylate synthase [Corynebacterium phocae]